MTRLKTIKEKYNKDTDFYGLKLPELKNISASLDTKVYEAKKGDVVIEHTENFSITINVKNIISSQKDDLNKLLNVATGRTLYLNKKEFFNYFTYDLDKDTAIDIFNKICVALQTFDKNYNIDAFIDVKEQDELINSLDERMTLGKLMFGYSKEREEFFVVALDKIDIEEYRVLAKNSKDKNYVSYTFLSDELPKSLKNKSCFFYNKNDYKFVADYIVKNKELADLKNQENTNLVNSFKAQYEELNYNTKNLAKFYIEFLPEEKGFFFYMLGYKPENYIFNERNDAVKDFAKHMIAVNNDASAKALERGVKIKLREEELHCDLKIPELTFEKIKSKVGKWFVPLEYFEELKIIKEEYDKNEWMFTRKESKVKPLTPQTELNIDSKYPGMCVDEKGLLYLFMSKNFDSEQKYYPISFDEAKKIIEEYESKDGRSYSSHGFMKNICTSERQFNPDIKTIDEALESAFRRAELKMLMDKQNESKTVVKRKKI